MAVRLFDRLEEKKNEKKQKFYKTLSQEDTLDKSIKFEDIPYGRMADNEENNENNMSSYPTTANPTRNETSRKKLDLFHDAKKRTTLRDEITISNQFQMKIPSYYERKKFDLRRIVEDQVI